MLCFDENLPKYEWLKIRQQNKCSFNHLYLRKFSSKYSKPYHFLDQFFEFFPMAAFIFAFEKLHKMIFIGYKDFEPHNGMWRHYDVIMMFSLLCPGLIWNSSIWWIPGENFKLFWKFADKTCKFMISTSPNFGESLDEPKYKLDEKIWAIFHCTKPNNLFIIPFRVSPAPNFTILNFPPKVFLCLCLFMFRIETAF